MRPRVFPAEDSGARGGATGGRAASMRPRVFPAEDATCYTTSDRFPSRFNEAAGIPRGRRERDGDDPREGCASMRPRVFPAEDVRGTLAAASALPNKLQ